jgi:transposase
LRVAHFVGPFLKEWAVLLQVVGISAMSSSGGKATTTSARPLLERIPLHVHARISDPKPHHNQNAKRDSSKASKRRFSQLRFQIRVCKRRLPGFFR